MKTKEVIRQLMEEDPSGELEVCVGNVDIHFISTEPAYYDGSLQVLQRDESKSPYYNIVGGKYVRSGSKVQIHTLSITDAISNAGGDGKFEVDYSELNERSAADTKKAHEELREWHKRLENSLEKEYFIQWAKEQADKITADTEDIAGIADAFFEKNVSPNDPLPEGGIPLGHSYVTTRNIQWDQKFQVAIVEGFLKIQNRQGTH